jgi:predicted ATP-grasp superfamily ATP-dependent carboligase
MRENESLLIVGASARAAAFSALRAGLRTECADLFADIDLVAACPVERITPNAYPHGFLDLAALARPGPWLYAGGLENHPNVVESLTQRRRLWGNPPAVLRVVRPPDRVAAILRKAGLPGLEVRRHDPPTAGGKWLVKPLAGAGGAGIERWVAGRTKTRRAVYWQEFLEGEACAAVYVGDGLSARLLGVTRQLVGADWLHAGEFRYCGSLGPLGLDEATRTAFEHLGDVLAGGCGLLGLFGVDCILRAGIPYSVEINPRYTASVEVLEHATGICALAMHRQMFESRADLSFAATAAAPVVGKAILFARAHLTFPETGPWNDSASARIGELPEFADIPRGGEIVPAGRPVLTFFSAGPNLGACEIALRERAQRLDRLLFGE